MKHSRVLLGVTSLLLAIAAVIVTKANQKDMSHGYIQFFTHGRPLLCVTVNNPPDCSPVFVDTCYVTTGGGQKFQLYQNKVNASTCSVPLFKSNN